MLKYAIYRYEDDGAVLVETLELDEDDVENLKKVAKLHKSSKTYVYPMNENGIWPLIKPGRRGASKLSDNHVIKIFELRADEGLSPFVIGSRLFSDHGVIVSGESVANVLARKTYADVDVPQELLDGVASRKVVRKKRNPITPEHKREIIELYDDGNGLGGTEIARLPQFPYTGATINTFLRKQFGYRK